MPSSNESDFVAECLAYHLDGFRIMQNLSVLYTFNRVTEAAERWWSVYPQWSFTIFTSVVIPYKPFYHLRKYRSRGKAKRKRRKRRTRLNLI